MGCKRIADVKMNRGSPTCTKQHPNILEQFQKNFPQCKIFRESGGISVGQGQRSKLDARDLKAQAGEK